MNPFLLEDTWSVIKFHCSSLEKSIMSSVSNYHYSLPSTKNKRKRMIDIASRQGHKGIVKWCHKNKQKLTDKTYIKAVKSGNLKLVKWLDKKKSKGNINKILCTAAKHGHRNILKWYYIFKHFSPSIEVFYNAVKHHQLKVVKWCFWIAKTEIKLSLDKVVEISAQYKSMEILKWLLKKNCTVSRHAFEDIISIGDINLFNMIKKKYPLPRIAATCAAKSGNLEIIKTCVENGAKIYGDTLYYAIKTQDLTIIKWVVENGFSSDGCQVDRFTLTEAEKACDSDIIDYLRSFLD